MYTVGKIYIWCNITNELECLLGEETTVLSEPIEMRDIRSGIVATAQMTDSKIDAFPGVPIYAAPGDLRERGDPDEAKDISENLFDRLKYPQEVQL